MKRVILLCLLFFTPLLIAFSASGSNFTQEIKLDSFADNSTTNNITQRISGGVEIVGTSDINKTRFGIINFANHAPNVTSLTSPSNASTQSSRTVSFSFNASDDFGFSNCSLWTDETGTFAQTQINASGIINNGTTTINHTFSSDGTFVWNIKCFDTRIGAQSILSDFHDNNYTVIISTGTSSPAPSDGTTTKSLELTYDFACSDGSLEVSTTSGAEVSLVELSPDYIQLAKKEAGSDGIALFTITEDVTYKIRATKSGYRSEDRDNLEFNLCEDLAPEFECTQNSNCGDQEQCLNNKCVLVTGECGYASNHEFVSYECCFDSDCEEGYECKENSCAIKPIVPPISPINNSQLETLEEINKAQELLNKARAEGKDISEAQKKLNEAFAAYNLGDYEKAKGLIDISLTSVKSSKEKQPEPPLQPKESEEEPSDLTGLSLMIGSAVVVVVVLAGAYVFLKGGKKGGYTTRK